MKKVTITEALIENAIDLARLSRDAHKGGNPGDEVRWSISIHYTFSAAYVKSSGVADSKRTRTSTQGSLSLSHFRQTNL